ncbi:Obg family GTPase CgtA [Cardinium endosymbiont of Sogatella furcifera]|uniref:GTPase ObgE n=1 Tax=Cardinium endosymbiont of Sogatella furcifera TaxID=650378 RepID=UPI000E0D3EB1|nr:GTPase ObgE [Cardinium endosymbiont of Sogatella furcifera]AXI24123.1 Obg family GTPase CgtA [Cardinium endosymbiont of Sogatella furcifera]
MSLPNFIDHVKLYLRAGKGGAGLVHFMRAKFVPKGGPDGGDGGRGGHIILRGAKQRNTLLQLKYRKHILATNGEPGGDSCKTGASGKDVLIDVPLGTVAKRVDDDQVLVEVLEDKKKYILMQGGKGGWGNAHFKTPTHQTPRIAYPGETGMEGWMVLELKLLADVGLVGLPNAGKSTLLSVVSAAKPRIDSYPFTTLVPNLGVVAYRADHSFVMADIPGIIEGAAAGKGLGTRFLRHIERNAILLFMVSAESNDIHKSYEMLLSELEAHNPSLLAKPRLLVVSKIDLLDQTTRKTLHLPPDITCCPISAHTGEGIVRLKDLIWEKLSV